MFVFAGVSAQESSKRVIKKTAKVVAVDAKSNVKSKVVSNASDGPSMLFAQETIDYGVIKLNSDGAREFVVTNNGNKPLIISNAQGSCGCTVPSFPKEPIAPGAKAVIGVRYDTSREGAINKSITLTTNVVGQEMKIIYIKGTVLPAEQKVPATVTDAAVKI